MGGGIKGKIRKVFLQLWLLLLQYDIRMAFLLNL